MSLFVSRWPKEKSEYTYLHAITREQNSSVEDATCFGCKKGMEKQSWTELEAHSFPTGLHSVGGALWTAGEEMALRVLLSYRLCMLQYQNTRQRSTTTMGTARRFLNRYEEHLTGGHSCLEL